MKKRIFAALTAALSLTAMLCGCSGRTSESNSNPDSSVAADNSSAAQEESSAAESAPEENNSSDKNELTSLDVIRQMGNGINLGNTLESYAHQQYLDGADPATLETSWGQPLTTAEMFSEMKKAGFDTVRIPITWLNGIKIESGDYTIDERLMNRVDEVVNWALDADMYVIINDHWDGGWWGWFGQEDQATRDKAMDFYKNLWGQIGEHFKDSSYKLIFESANEELGSRLNDMNEFNEVKGVLTEDECYETTNKINAEFVNTIRAQGGKNADRFLLIAGYNTNIEKTCDDRFKMPEDSADSKLLVSVHYYDPWTYCATKAGTAWGSPDEYKDMNNSLKMMSKFSDNGIGVVIGEYTVMYDGLDEKKPNTEEYTENLLNNCDLYDYCPVLWDRSEFFDRNTKAMKFDTIASIYDTRRYANETSAEDTKAAAQTALDEALKNAEETYVEPELEPVDDSVANAWIMYSSGDWGVVYSNGDTFDPNNKAPGVVATNTVVEGEGEYSVSLDLSAADAKGASFAALGISNGEQLFPGYTYTIDSVWINGIQVQIGKGYTTSDDGKCTRVNLYNEWVSEIPAGARTADGDLTDCKPIIVDFGSDEIQTFTVNFTAKAPN